MNLDDVNQCIETRAFDLVRGYVKYTSHLPPIDPLLLSSKIFVPFPVKRIRAAKILWINDRWFSQRNVEIATSSVRHRIGEELLSLFGVEAIDIRTSSARNVKYQRLLYADRYGQSMGSVHGGSGRCGALLGYNAKGIGRTPLVSDEANWEHTHGFLWLEDAIREAILAEVADAELPYGAVPVVAIIDTGKVYRDSEGNLKRRAVVVRPDFVRLGHFERSATFGDAGHTMAAQYLDAIRVREAILNLCGAGATKETVINRLSSIFLRFGWQKGFERALRLWPGRFLSSNVTINASVVDFGIFRSLPNWCKWRGVNVECFGNDELYIKTTISSLCFYINKYMTFDLSAADEEILWNKFDNYSRSGFLKACANSIGFDDTTSVGVAMAHAILNLYNSQQKFIRANKDTVLVGNQLMDCFDRALAGDDGHLAVEMREVVRSFFTYNAVNKGAPIGVNRLRRWFSSRRELDSRVLRKSSIDICAKYLRNAVEDDGIVKEYIRRTLEISIYTWPGLPRDFDVVDAQFDGISWKLKGNYSGKSGSENWIVCPNFSKRANAYEKVKDLAR